MTTQRYSRVLRTIPLLIAVCFAGLPAQAQYGGGTGGPGDPYLIYTAEQMNEIGLHEEDWDKHFKLMADIDLSGFAGTDFNIIGYWVDWPSPDNKPFAGVFDGNGKKISNFSYSSTDTDCAGLFGYVEGAEIKDLELTYPNIDAGERDYVGSLVGLLEDGTIADCYVEGGSIAGKHYVGGLVGRNLCGWGISPDDFVDEWLNDDPYTGGMTRLIIGRKFVGRVSEMTVHGYGRCGGDECDWGTINVPYTGNPFVAVYEHGFVTNTLTIHMVTLDSLHVHSSDVFHDGTNRDSEWDYSMHRASGAVTYAGGLVLKSYGNSTITNCYSTASISGAKDVGGLVGNNAGTISNCYARDGNVSGNDNIGGLVGKNYATISNCYSEGDVSGGDAVGGLVGSNSYGTVTNCYSTSGVLGNEYIAGLVGQNWGGTITNCRATGMVLGSGTISFLGSFLGVGGLVGFNSGTITNCYSIGVVTGTGNNVGGLVGRNYGSVTGSFWDVETSGQTSSAAGTGKTTAEMQMESTFIGWGCEPDWTIDDGADYPRLAWENMPGKTIIALSYNGTGSGTQADPYLLYTAEELNMIGLSPCEWDRHFKLMADIDLSAYSGTQFNMIGKDSAFPFAGVFDGNGHTVSNFSYTSTDTYYIGLFRCVSGENAVIKDLGLIAPDVDAGTGDRIGSLVGWLEDGAITGCYVEGGSVSGNDDVGSLVGYNGGTVTNCYADGGSVTGYISVGGLVGYNDDSIITDCYSSANVSGTGRITGGLVGYDQGGEITNCYTNCNVTGGEFVGGLAGVIQGSIYAPWGPSIITNCYSIGGVSGNGRVGGLVGALEGGTITNCYSIGGVSGGFRDVGGLVGALEGGTITNCYSTGSVSGGFWDVGGLVGRNGDGTITNSFWDIETSRQTTSDGGTGKTTAEMQDMNTFIAAGWDFVGEFENGPSDHWAMPAGGGYPILWRQLPRLPPLPAFSGGTGEADDPYLISSAEDLNRIGHNPRLMAAHFKLIDHIDMTGVDFFIIGSELSPFTGVFDGNSMRISNFSYVSTNTYSMGLFGYVNGENAQIKDVGLIDPNVSGRNDVGSLVGYLEKGTVYNSHTQGGSVTGKRFVGGLVGTNSGTVSGCQSSASVSGEDGGLVGRNVLQGLITNCYSAGNVSGDLGVGGLAGYNGVYAKIMYCYSTGSVSGNENVGGLVGLNAGTLTGCYSVGDVTGNEKVGGLVGDNTLGAIVSSYSLGTASGTANVGGLIGIGGGAYNSYWDTQTSGLSTSSGGAGRTTAEMQMASTFVGWGHDPVWTIDEGKDYPRLWWENMPGEIVTTVSPFEAVAGAGTEVDPYLIYTAGELDIVGQFPYAWDKHFKLMADIDLGGYTGEAFNIIGRYGWPFTGVFDGNDKIISRFSYTSPLAHSVGLFRSVKGESAQIKGLGLVDPNIDAGMGMTAGALVGWLARGGTISNCYAEGGSVRGSDYVGGLVGENWGMITGCYATGSVSGEDWGIGGLAGINPGTITNSHASGSVSGTRNVGGLTGNSADAITNSYATGTVSGSERVGGLVGNSWGSITNSYAAGSVSGISDVGGLAGRNTRTITYCYSTGSVAGTSDFGGLVGAGNGTVIFSFWDTQTGGQPASDGGTPKTTAEMQTADTFLEAGWDFVDETTNGTEDIWWILEGQDYPRLWWELIPEN